VLLYNVAGCGRERKHESERKPKLFFKIPRLAITNPLMG
jgi:hypothetical protein